MFAISSKTYLYDFFLKAFINFIVIKDKINEINERFSNINVPFILIPVRKLINFDGYRTIFVICVDTIPICLFDSAFILYLYDNV